MLNLLMLILGVYYIARGTKILKFNSISASKNPSPTSNKDNVPNKTMINCGVVLIACVIFFSNSFGLLRFSIVMGCIILTSKSQKVA